MDDRKFPPNVMLTQLRQKVSSKGAYFLEGRLGLAKVLLLQSNKTDEDGNPIWNLCVQEFPREDAPKASASKPAIFSSAEPAQMAAAAGKSGKFQTIRAASSPADYEFDDRIDDLWPGGN